LRDYILLAKLLFAGRESELFKEDLYGLAGDLLKRACVILTGEDCLLE
jgi:hypothetical protein